MPSVFLSYARADDDPNYDDASKSFMRRLYDALTAEGFDVWWDREKLPARSLSFTDEIEAAIRACERFVLIAGPGAKDSDYVTAEWTFALAQCKPITPALREGDDDYANIPDELRDINAIDCRATREESAAFKDIINKLREDAPLGDKIGVKDVPRGYVNRPAPYNAAHKALMADAIQATVISTPGRDAAPQSAISVYGLGGIGKSTLAAALANDCAVRRHFRDGVIWLEVGQTPSVASLQASVGVHFGDLRENYQDERDGALSLSRALRDKTALLVLDDVWDHKIVERFPVGATACRLLITTRSGALASRVQGADVRLDLLSPDEGAAIIAARTNDHDPLYRKISETLGGHTLAVTLAALQIAEDYADDAADLLRLLDKRAQSGEPFVDLAVDEDDKDLNLALSLSLSYDALRDDDLRRRFRATGIFALEGSFDRAALAAVWGDADEDDARKPIQVLVGAGLLDEVPALIPPTPFSLMAKGEQDTGDSDSEMNDEETTTPKNEGKRYSQHRLLRAYARALLAEAGELNAVFERYADFYTARATEIFIDLPPEQWNQHDADLPDITALGDALMERTEHGTSGDITRAIEFARSTGNYLFRRRETHKWPWLEMGLNAVRALRIESPEDETLLRRESLFLTDLGSAWSALGENRKALAYYEPALEIDRKLRDQQSEATALNNIGSAWDALGEKQKALEYYEATTPLYRAVGDRGGEATTLNNIGLAWDVLGEKRKALDYYEQALALFRAVGDRSGEAATLNNIGLAWDALGEKRKALDYYEQALLLRRAVGDRGGEAITLNNIGMVWNDLGEKRKALDYYEQTVPVFRAVGDRDGEAGTLNNMSYIYFQEGDLEKTIHIQQQIINIDRAIGDVTSEAVHLYNIAIVYQHMGRIDEAIQSAKAGREILIGYDLPQNAGGATVAQYDALLAQLRGETIPTQNTMPVETVNTLTENTVAVMTSLPEQREEWREGLQTIRDDFAGQGADWGIEVAFTDALLAILHGETPTLAEGNPYAEAVWRVAQSIEGYDPSAQGTTEASLNTLPAETVNQLMGNTVAVMTSVPDKREEWRGMMQNTRDDFAGRGADWEIEVAFVDALLAILDGDTPSLPEDNPYAEVVWRVTQSIEAYHLAAHGTVEVESETAPEVNTSEVSAEDAQAEFIENIVALYRQGGAAAVRSTLAAGGVPEEMIAEIVRGLESMGGGGESE